MDNCTSPIPSTLKVLLQSMIFISKIEVGNKINFKSMSLSSDDSWIDSLWRYWSGEGREEMIKKIDGLIDSVIVSIEQYSESEFCSLIVNHLADCLKGIENLKETYKEDHNITSSLDVTIQNIKIQLFRNKTLLINYHFDVSMSSLLCDSKEKK